MTAVSYTHLDVYKRQQLPWQPEALTTTTTRSPSTTAAVGGSTRLLITFVSTPAARGYDGIRGSNQVHGIESRVRNEATDYGEDLKDEDQRLQDCTTTEEHPGSRT